MTGIDHTHYPILSFVVKKKFGRRGPGRNERSKEKRHLIPNWGGSFRAARSGVTRPVAERKEDGGSGKGRKKEGRLCGKDRPDRIKKKKTARLRSFAGD